jgi:hypothetical protein
MDSIYSSLDFKDSITISIFFAAYDKIEDSAGIKNYFYEYEEQLFDSTGRVNNPYELHYCYASALSKDTVFVENDSSFTLNFLLPSNLIQDFPSLDSIFINFNTGWGFERNAEADDGENRGTHSLRNPTEKRK